MLPIPKSLKIKLFNQTTVVRPYAMLLLFILLSTIVSATICPGYDLGISLSARTVNNDAGKFPYDTFNYWIVYSTACGVHEFILENENENPCTTEFGCDTGPNINLYNDRLGNTYHCTQLAQSGYCGIDQIGVCCWLDGEPTPTPNNSTPPFLNSTRS
jgi:hypothetical protein